MFSSTIILRVALACCDWRNDFILGRYIMSGTTEKQEVFFQHLKYIQELTVSTVIYN